jgi:hypothetical protein
MVYNLTKLTPLQRRILAVMEEPGGYSLTVLANTVARPRGVIAEIDAMTIALGELLISGLINIASRRDEHSRHWIALPACEASLFLKSLISLVEWSGKFWVWRPGVASTEVILTEGGVTAAQTILSEDGWPEHPLDRYA